MNKLITVLMVAVSVSSLNGYGHETNITNRTNMEHELTILHEWDKVFPLSDKVCHQKVTFRNHFGITLAVDVYTPKNADRAGVIPYEKIVTFFNEYLK